MKMDRRDALKNLRPHALMPGGATVVGRAPLASLPREQGAPRMQVGLGHRVGGPPAQETTTNPRNVRPAITGSPDFRARKEHAEASGDDRKDGAGSP